jgi:hypothetical protein
MNNRPVKGTRVKINHHYPSTKNKLGEQGTVVGWPRSFLSADCVTVKWDNRKTETIISIHFIDLEGA